MAAAFVLDAFALMALLRREPGRDRVRELFELATAGDADLAISAINAGEVFYRIERQVGPGAGEHFVAELRRAPVTVVEATWDRVLAAAAIKARHPLSYAHAFTVVLARERGAPIVTGDPAFQAVEGIVQVEWLPRR